MDYNFDILDYTEPVFRFCLKRLNSRADAEDLSQEILLHILDGMRKNNVKNPQAYVWQIAHNRYARKIDGKNKQNKREFYSGDMTLYSIADNNFAEDKIILFEEYKSVFNALHSLSALYRDILVDYYVGEMYIQEIAKKYNLTKETVKWRLHVAKEKIEERVNNMNTDKIYKKLDWNTGTCNGSMDSDKYLNRQIYRAIAFICYEKPLDIEEISLKTGIPTLYLEEPLEHMINGDAIEKNGNKYATNFIILFAEDSKKMQKSAIEAAKNLPEKVWDIVKKSLPEIKENLAYGKDFPDEKLGYLFVPIFLRNVIGKAREADKSLLTGEYPKRKDGGYGWFIVSENCVDLESLGAGCNSYHSEKSGIHYDMYYYHFGKTFRGELNRFFHKYGLLADFFDENGVYVKSDDELKAELLKNNIMRKNGGEYKSNIPITTKSNADNINKILARYENEIIPLLTGFIRNNYNEYKRFVPERLYDQIRGNLGCSLHEIIGITLNELAKQKLLRDYTMTDYTNTEIFTDNVLFVVG